MSKPPQRLYSTDLFVTVNPHRTYSTGLHEDFRAAIVALTEPATAQRVLGESAKHPTIYEARIEAEEIGWELSKRQRFLHAHFLLELTHSGGLHLGPLGDPEGVGTQRRLQLYFDRALGVPGVYVHASLAPSSRAKNYMRKAQARESEGEEGHVISERTFTRRPRSLRRSAASP